MSIVKHAQIYLTTSLYEGLPIAVLEALAMGKPIVSSNVIGNQDCVKNEVNGYLLPMDADRMADAVCSLLTDHGLRQQMGEASLALFEKEFLIDNRISDLERIYKQVAPAKKTDAALLGGGKSEIILIAAAISERERRLAA